VQEQPHASLRRPFSVPPLAFVDAAERRNRNYCPDSPPPRNIPCSRKTQPAIMNGINIEPRTRIRGDHDKQTAPASRTARRNSPSLDPSNQMPCPGKAQMWLRLSLGTSETIAPQLPSEYSPTAAVKATIVNNQHSAIRATNRDYGPKFLRQPRGIRTTPDRAWIGRIVLSAR